MAFSIQALFIKTKIIDTKGMVLIWTHEDQGEALKQGWGIFAVDVRGEDLRILKYVDFDLPKKFENDEQAISYVRGRADAGDNRAIVALQITEKED